VNLDASSNATESRRAVVLWLLSASSSTRSIAADSLEKLRLNRAALAKNAALVATNATHIAKAALLYKFPVCILKDNHLKKMLTCVIFTSLIRA
jgi:hypothetical protein